MEQPDEVPDEEPLAYRPPLPPDDRVWRHPSELGHGAARAGAGAAATTTDNPDRRGTWSVALLSGLIGSVLTFGLVAATGGLDQADQPVEREIVVRESVMPVLGPGDADQRPAGTVVDIAEAVRPAIVRIEVTGGEGVGSGSGVVFRDNGYVLTNAHVVREADAVRVSLAGGDELPAVVMGADARTDIAVLKVEDDGPFPTAVLGTATKLRVGQPAIAIGSPLGLDGGPSVTAGVISALGRRVDGTGGPSLLDMIQTDAPIAPGSSGGALVDDAGAVIGITTAIAVSQVGAEGLGFATPIDIARSVAEDLIAVGRARHAWLGIAGSDLGAEAIAGLGTDLDIDGGAVIEDVYPGSPAAAAGFHDGDVIIGVERETVGSMSDLVVLLRRRRPGDQVRIRYVRDGRLGATAVVLGELPADLADE